MHFGIISKLNLQCNLYSLLFFEKLRFYLQAFSNCRGCFIATVMGQRIEPIVSIPTELQTDSTGFTLESVIHIGCYPPLRILRTVKDSNRTATFFRLVRKWDFFAKK